MVISTTTVPAADSAALANIGTSTSVAESTSSSPDALVTQSKKLNISLSTYNANVGIKQLDLQPNFYDTMASEATVVGLRTDYNLISWDGGPEAYLRLGLKPNSAYPNGRGPQFSGTCSTPYPGLTCTSTSPNLAPEYMKPWNCTDASGRVEGDLGDADYRLRCEIPCNRQRDCQALCACADDCSGRVGRFCVCDACLALSEDATTDEEYQKLVSDGETKVGNV